MALFNHFLFKALLTVLILAQLLALLKGFKAIRLVNQDLADVTISLEKVINDKEIVQDQLDDLNMSFDEVFSHLAYKSYKQVDIRGKKYKILPFKIALENNSSEYQ